MSVAHGLKCTFCHFIHKVLWRLELCDFGRELLANTEMNTFKRDRLAQSD